ncbi:MAG TPA: Fe-S cluster assembly protein SufD [Terriglobia bacterium]|nr:Fe-S cluster assembly protein SufD [Terriglobia bacterium]
MNAVKEHQETYFKNFAEFERRRAAKEPAWLQAIRKTAFHQFADLGFPTTHHEEWKYTSVAPLARIQFRPASDYLAPKEARHSSELLQSNPADSIALCFYAGQFVEELTPTNSLPAGVKVTSLAKAIATGSPLLEKHFARYAEFGRQPFVALNTAFAEDGALIEISPDVVLTQPIYLRFVAGPGHEPLIYHPRNLVVLGRGSQATVVEQYLSARQDHQQLYFTNAVTEVVLGENARIEHIKEQFESHQAFHVATLHIHQERSSSASTTSIAFGSALAREDVIAVLDGLGAECTLNGLYVTTGSQHVDNHTTIDHAQPHCSSRELYKGILDGKSTGVFNGKIVVRKDAQKTDSKQSNKNLLLAEDCVINTKPQLEIFADDVKCTHGATIGQIDAESIFYLRSRGIGHEQARAMLTLAFANDVLGKIKSEPLRTRLEQTLSEKLTTKQGRETSSLRADAEGQQTRRSTLHEDR